MPPVSGPVAVDLTGDLEASFDGDLLRVRGRVENVPYGRFVSSLILIAPVDGGEVALEIEGPSLEWEHAENMAGEPRDGAAIDLVSANVSRPVADVRSGVVDVAALATTWAMVGAMERVRDLTVSYTQGREQFGRPLASFQAVKQLAAVIVGEVSVAAAAAEEATALVMADGPSDFAIAAARVRAAQAVAPVSRHAHQLHGAIGYTREYPLHQFTRRLWSWREEGGTQWQWTRLAGERVLAGAPSDPLWQTIAV
jgi:hypothetical protein